MDRICVESNGRQTAAHDEVCVPSHHHRHTHHHRIQQQQQPQATSTAAAAAAAGRRVCRKYHRAYIGRLQQREYDKLRRIVPALSALNHEPSSCSDCADTEQATSRRSNHHGARIADCCSRDASAPPPRVRRPVSKIKVIEETIRYIDELHNALARRVQAEQQLDTEDTATILKTQLTSNSSISAAAVDVAAVAEAAKSVFIARVLNNDASTIGNGCYDDDAGCHRRHSCSSLVTIGNGGSLDDAAMTSSSRCFPPGMSSDSDAQ